MRVGVCAANMFSENTFRNAGISRVSFQLIDALSQLPDHEWIVFTRPEFTPPPSWKQRSNLKIVPDVPNQTGGKAVWENLIASRFARRPVCDVWLSTSHSVPMFATAPTIAFIHDMIPLARPEFQSGAQSAYLRRALVYASRRATRVLTNSEASKEEIVRFASVPEAKVTVMPLGPGRAPETSIPMEVPFARYLFALGTLEPRKNLVALIEAMGILKASDELQGLGLAIGGGRGWKENPIFDAVERLRLTNDVKFLGYVDDGQLAGLFEGSLAFVFPSLAEGFGMPILEAMSAGAPVLTGNQGAMAELASDAAVLFNPSDPADIARAIRQAMTMSEDERRRLSERGRARAQTYTWSAAAEIVDRLIRDLAPQETV